jgi:hypothetical protein
MFRAASPLSVLADAFVLSPELYTSSDSAITSAVRTLRMLLPQNFSGQLVEVTCTIKSGSSLKSI